jgi:hypothetical protein
MYFGIPLEKRSAHAGSLVLPNFSAYQLNTEMKCLRKESASG